MISDEAAYRQYLSGDDHAAEPLVEKYGDALTLYIMGYLKDIQESEDLMIEAFSLMFAKARPVSAQGSFKAYLYKVARHLALRHLRRGRLGLMWLEELPFEVQSEVFADTKLLQNERNCQLYQAMGQLKAEYREALYLTYFENMSYRDAAAVMGKSEQQITKLVYRGKQNLKTTLEQEGFSYAE